MPLVIFTNIPYQARGIREGHHIIPAATAVMDLLGAISFARYSQGNARPAAIKKHPIAGVLMSSIALECRRDKANSPSFPPPRPCAARPGHGPRGSPPSARRPRSASARKEAPVRPKAAAARLLFARGMGAGSPERLEARGLPADSPTAGGSRRPGEGAPRRGARRRAR